MYSPALLEEHASLLTDVQYIAVSDHPIESTTHRIIYRPGIDTLKNENLESRAERLLGRIQELGSVGATAEAGVRRLALTSEDRDGRNRVVSWMKQSGLEVRIDQIGNIFGIRAGKSDLAPVMTGSHIDTVYNGGILDGNLGVLAGLEIVDVLNDFEVETNRPFVVAVFTNEEGARFQPDMMGSLVYAGGYDLDTALQATSSSGENLGEELKRIGYAGKMKCGAIIPCAFLELHIEQGPVLEAQGITVGAVESLQGISWTEVTITGQANHAGTTPMSMRKDAGACAGKLVAFVHQLAIDIGDPQVATVGVIELKPNIINVVPGSARITIDLRNPDNSILTDAENNLEIFLQELGEKHDVIIATTRLVRFDPVQFDDRLVALVEKNAERLGLSYRRMTSGAGHDAQMMSRICPSAMIFTPSINGISHNPAEATDDADLIAGANVLLQTVFDLLDDQPG